MGLGLFILDYQIGEICRISSATYRAFPYRMTKIFLSLLIILGFEELLEIRIEARF